MKEYFSTHFGSVSSKRNQGVARCRAFFLGLEDQSTSPWVGCFDRKLYYLLPTLANILVFQPSIFRFENVSLRDGGSHWEGYFTSISGVVTPFIAGDGVHFEMSKKVLLPGPGEMIQFDEFF